MQIMMPCFSKGKLVKSHPQTSFSLAVCLQKSRVYRRRKKAGAGSRGEALGSWWDPSEVCMGFASLEPGLPPQEGTSCSGMAVLGTRALPAVSFVFANLRTRVGGRRSRRRREVVLSCIKTALWGFSVLHVFLLFWVGWLTESSPSALPSSPFYWGEIHICDINHFLKQYSFSFFKKSWVTPAKGVKVKFLFEEFMLWFLLLPITLIPQCLGHRLQDNPFKESFC